MCSYAWSCHQSVFACLTQRDWSLMRLMNRGDNFARRTSGEVELETIMKHSAQAFLMPHRLSEHRSKNLGIYVKSKAESVSCCQQAGVQRNYWHMNGRKQLNCCRGCDFIRLSIMLNNANGWNLLSRKKRVLRALTSSFSVASWPTIEQNSPKFAAQTCKT